MKYQILFWGKNKKNITNLSSAELTQRMVKVNPFSHADDTFHYENMPIQIYRKFHLQKTESFQIKKNSYFSYFCSKHRLWVPVRTASERRF